MPLRSIAEQDEAADKKFRSALLSLSERAGASLQMDPTLEVYNSQQQLEDFPETSMPLSADVHEALHAVHTNYISLWQDNAVPWKEPVFRGDSHLGSMVPSYNSEVSVSPACPTMFLLLATPPEL